MHALVSGATGYIGVHVCRALCDAGWTVAALVRHTSACSRLDPRVVQHDIADLDAAFAARATDAVIHLASLVTPHHGQDLSERIFQDNILLGTQILDAMIRTPCRRFVTAGSYWEYAEDGSYRPNTLYAASKRAFTDLLVWYARHYRISAASLILFDVYGPADWRAKLLPSLVHNVCAETDPLAMTAGTQLLDFVHVEDVAKAFVQSLSHLPDPDRSPAIWSVDTGRRVTLRALVDLMSSVAPRPLRVKWGEKDWPEHQIMHPLRKGAFPSLPGWSATIDLERGLAELFDQNLTISTGSPS